MFMLSFGKTIFLLIYMDQTVMLTISSNGYSCVTSIIDVKYCLAIQSSHIITPKLKKGHVTI